MGAKESYKGPLIANRGVSGQDARPMLSVL
jgi:hypothetical protein